MLTYRLILEFVTNFLDIFFRQIWIMSPKKSLSLTRYDYWNLFIFPMKLVHERDAKNKNSSNFIQKLIV